MIRKNTHTKFESGLSERTMKTSFVDRLKLVLAVIICIFLWSTKAYTQVSTLATWTNAYHNTGNPSVTVTVPTGSNTYRILIVGVASSQTATGNARTATVTYGGQTLTLAAGDMATTTTRQHTAIYYLLEAGIDAASNTTLAITFGGGTVRVNDVWSASYDYVDQSSPTTNSQNYNNITTAAATFVWGTALNLNYDDQSILVASSIRAGNTTPRTFTAATNWTSTNEQTFTTTDGVRNGVFTRSISTTTTTDVASTTLSGTALGSMTGISLNATTKLYRSASSTTWGTLAAWQQSMDAGTSWVSATTAPANTDGSVNIRSPHSISLSATTTATSLAIDDGGTLTAGAFALTVAGTTTVGNGTSGTLTISSATGTKTFTGAVTINAGGAITESAAATLSFGSDVTISGTLTENGAATVDVAGNFTNNGAYTASTGTHTFSGTSKIISGTTTNTIPTVAITGTISNTGTLTINTGLSGAGTLTNNNNSSLNIGAGCTVTTLANAGTLVISGSGNFTTATANFTNTDTLTMGGSGTVAGITNNAGGLVTLNTSGTITAFNNATSTSTLNITTTPTVPTITTLTATVAGNTVKYSASGTQTVKGTTYVNLTLSGSSAKTTTSVTVNGILSLEGTATVSTAPTFGSASTIQYKTTTTSLTATTAEFPNAFAGTGGVIIDVGSGQTVVLNASKTAISGNLYVKSGTLDLSSFTINRFANTLTLQIDNGAKLKIGGTGTFPSSYTTHTLGATSTVEYAGTTTSVAALLSSQVYGNLTISGSGVTSATSYAVATALSVTGSLVASAGTVTMNNGSSISNAGTLTFSALTIAASATVTTSSSFSVIGTLTVGSSANFSPSGGTITMSNAGSGISNSGTLAFSGLSVSVTPSAQTQYNASYTVSGALTVVGAINFSPSGGTITMSGSSGSISNASGTLGFSALTISGTTVTATGTISVASTMTISGAFTSTSGTLSLAGDFTNNGTFTHNSGTVVFNGSNQAIGGSATTTTFNTLTCNTSGTKTMGNNVTVSGTLTLSSAKLAIAANTLTLNGNLSGTSATNCFVGGSTSNLSIGGSGTLTGSIFLDPTTVSDTCLNDFTINRVSTGVVNIGNKVKVYGDLTPTAGTLNSGGFLVIASNATATGNIMSGSGTVSGTVIVQRFVPSVARRFRFLTSTITNGTLGDWKSETHITGTGSNFDATASNYSSVYSYDETVAGSLNNGWTAATDGSTTALTPGKGFRVFIRGSRNAACLTDNSTVQDAITMDLQGPVNSGNITMPVSYTGTAGDTTDNGWNFLGNPYPCALDWATYFNSGRTGSSPDYSSSGNYAHLDSRVYIYFAGSNSYFGYNAVSGIGTGTFSTGIIPSGAAFFVKAFQSSGLSFTMKETAKTNATPAAIYKTGTQEYFRIKMIKDSVNSDEMVLNYRDTAMSGYDAYDLRKFYGPEVNIASIATDGGFLTVNVKPFNGISDTIPLSIGIANAGNYSLEFKNPDLLIPNNSSIAIYLVDNFTGKMVDVRTAGHYLFSADPANSNSFGNDRFKIIIGGVTGLNDVPPQFLENERKFYMLPTFTSDFTTIFSSTAIHGKADIRVYDIMGKQVVKNNQLNWENNSVKIDLSTMKTGVYFIRVQSDETAQPITLKVMKQ